MIITVIIVIVQCKKDRRGALVASFEVFNHSEVVFHVVPVSCKHVEIKIRRENANLEKGAWIFLSQKKKSFFYCCTKIA